MIKFEIIGECHAKGRPRFAKQGNFVRTYTDQKTTNYENLVKLSYINSGCKSFKNDEALKCDITIYKSIPKSVSKIKREQMINKTLLPITKPDLDNCIKSILDGLNKVAFNDDKQIVELSCRKFYGEEAKTIVIIEEV